MKTFIIILSDIPNQDSDSKFADYISENNFEFWRHTPLNWILLTPDEITTVDINKSVMEAYGKKIFICVLQVDIKGYAGVFQKPLMPTAEIESPFSWFQDLFKTNDFVPKWEANKKKNIRTHI